jgi:CheY-like chemotaxis protein/PAS domain-containing protein
LAVVATAGSLPTALDALVRWVERCTSARCSVSLVDPARQVLIHGAAPSLPAAFNAAAHELPIADGVGSCGTAAATGMVVIVDDIATDPRWAMFRETAREFGLAACWSQPVLASSGEVLGTFALYHDVPATPTPDDRQLMSDAALVAALVIERARIDEARRSAEAARLEASVRLRRIADAVEEALLLCDVATGRIRFANAVVSAFAPAGEPFEGQRLRRELIAAWVHADDLQTIETFVRDAFAGRAPEPVEIRQVVAGFPTRWMRCRAVVVQANAHGAPSRVLFLGSDVTAARALASRSGGDGASRPPSAGGTVDTPAPFAAPGSPQDRLRGRRVLVVDDEPDVLRVVAKRLERLGCVVDTAVDGDDALERLLAAPSQWHLVLTDQTMPRRTGEQLLIAMRDAGLTVPVVVMSGYSATVTPDRMLALGARAFLAKPFDGAQLLEALAAAL